MSTFNYGNVSGFFNGEKLAKAMTAAFYDAGRDDVKVAQAKCAWAHVRNKTRLVPRGTNRALIVAGKDAHWLELGIQPHSIAPGRKLRTSSRRSINPATGLREFTRVSASGRGAKGRVALKFEHGDQGFSRGTVRHPGVHAQPFLRPAAAVFPTLYRRRAGQRLRAIH